MHSVSTLDSKGYFDFSAAGRDGAEDRILRMLMDANPGDRKAAVGIVSRMISARRFRPVEASSDLERVLACLDELELLFALELSSIEDELLPASVVHARSAAGGGQA